MRATVSTALRSHFSRRVRQAPVRGLSTPAAATAETKVKVRARRPPAALEVTPAAAVRIRDLLSRRSPPAAGVRIGLRTRGCNGMAYTLNYADEANKFDEKVEIEGAKGYRYTAIDSMGNSLDFSVRF